MRTWRDVRPLRDPTFSTASMTSLPVFTRPKTTCLPSRWEVIAVVTKNCEPCVLRPALAIESKYFSVCAKLKFSSLTARSNENRNCRRSRH
jgi:hypothetical protein